MSAKKQPLSRRVVLKLHETLDRVAGPPAPDPPDHKIYLMRVPKCAGTSIAGAMKQLYTGSTTGLHRTVGNLNAEASTRAGEILGRNELDFNRQLLLYYLAATEYRFVHGHFTFDETAWSEFHQTWSFVTVIREPVRKWFSLYFYNRDKNKDYHKITEPLAEFVEGKIAVGYGRDYVMQFAREHPGSDEASSGAIERAKRNLDRFHLVGVLDRLDRFAADFEKMFGRKLSFPELRRSPVSKKAQDAEVTPEIMEKVQHICRPNSEIYDYVVNELIGE